MPANIKAKQHSSQLLLEHADETGLTGSTLHQDATTKHHTHVQGIQTTLRTGQQLTLCLNEVASGDADAYYKVFLNAVDDLAEFSPLPSEEAKAKLIASFKSFMNDQCSVNGVLNKKIEQLRKEVLPSVIDYSSMSAEDIAKAESMGHYACRMHLLANFATAADKGVLAYEEAVSTGKNPHAYNNDDESGTLRLIRTSAKALTKRGCDQAGVNSYFESFLATHNRSNHIVTYVGHRFNVMFVDAAAVFYHKDDIKTFLQLMPDPNRLLRAVAWDVKQRVYEAALRALGLLSKFVMEPFYKLLIDGKSILDINNDLEALHVHLDSWSKDGSGIFSSPNIFEKYRVPADDEVLSMLFQETKDCELRFLNTSGCGAHLWGTFTSI